MRKEFENLLGELSKVVVGSRPILVKLLVGVFTNGHVLLVGVPGLAKTLMVRALARVLGLSFSRVQFTPDLMPSDITGTEILKGEEFVFNPGPVFANVVLADEINRAPPKTQAALLEVMQERRVTYSGKTYPVPKPFFVLATQNPIEQEGTYPLPEAQLDRFLMQVDVDYPSYEDELKIARHEGFQKLSELSQVMSPNEILALQEEISNIPVPDHVVDYVVRLVRATRPTDGSPKVVREYVRFGAGPRASQYLLWSARTLAFMKGEPVPTTEEVRELFFDVLKHRVILHFRAEAEGVRPVDVLQEVLRGVKVRP